MVTGKKKTLIKVFSGTPWEAASVKDLLRAAYINVSEEDKGTKDIHLSVSSEQYSAAVRVIGSRFS